MGTIVWSAAVSHTGAMMRALPRDQEDRARAERVYAAFRTLSASLRAARPDVIIAVATDHFETFHYTALPVFAIGTGNRFEGWGEYEVPKRTYQGTAEFGAHVHAELLEAGFDALSARNMMLDHSFSCPLQLLMSDWDAPILPVYVNCTIPPLPSIERCRRFGVALGEIVRRQAAVERVAIVGTGGLSHWVGTPQTGTINVEFDQKFLKLFSAGEIAKIAQWDSEEVIESSGNGAAEIRNWLLAAAAAGAAGANVIAYEPVYSWSTGIAVTELIQ